MSKEKKYYWMKLKDGFFADPKIKKLRKIAGGDTFTIILQKIMLLSIKDGGALEFQRIEATFAEELALILDEDVENVKVTLSFMQINGLIEAIGEEEFFLPNVPPLIGSETDSAERVRRFREKQKALEAPKQALQCNGEVTTSNTEIEKREKRKEIEKEERKIEKKNIVYDDRFLKIWDYYQIGGQKGDKASAWKSYDKCKIGNKTSEEIKAVLDYEMAKTYGQRHLSTLLNNFDSTLEVAKETIQEPERTGYEY